MTTKEKEELKENEVKHEKLNDGEPFTVPDWTYGKHKNVVKRMASIQKKYESSSKQLSKGEQTRLLENFIIIESLKEAGVEVSEEIIDTLHPNDRLQLYAKCYMSGRRGIEGDAPKKGQEEEASKE